MLNRIKNFYKARKSFIDRFGWIKGYRISRLVYPSTREVYEQSINIEKGTIYLRVNTIDESTFTKIFLDMEYLFETNFEPRYIIDLGANIGLSAAYLNSRWPEALIHAVEPDDDNFSLLEKNSINFKRKSLFKGAIWYRPASLMIKNKEAGSTAFVVEEVEQSEYGSIRAFTIDQIFMLSGMQEIDVLKIDIEGAEKELFTHNFENWLPKTKILIIELHDRIQENCSKHVHDALNNYNFEMFEKGENEFWVNKDYNVTVKL